MAPYRSQTATIAQRLEDLTNDRNWRLPSLTSGNDPQCSLQPKMLRRSKSFHDLQRRLYSSESIASVHPSIYDADPVLSTDDITDQEFYSFSQEHWPLPPLGPSHSPSFENLSQLAEHPASLSDPSLPSHARSKSHSNWPAEPLDTIVEQISHNTLRTSLSSQPSRFRSKSPPTSTNLQNPIAAKTPNVKRLQKGNLRLATLCHRRSSSLNDVDCLAASISHRRHEHDSESSSNGELHTTCLYPIYPIQPQQSPPERRPTPPGLPTFGTKEAMEYRMPSTFHRIFSSALRDRRSSREASTNAITTQVATATSDPLTTSANLSPSFDALKRLLGMNRVVVSPPPEERRRSTMPNHLYLARAADGTYVRGRFGARHSGHGIGQRQLDEHPFHLTFQGVSPITRACREIDMACTEAQANAPRGSIRPSSERPTSVNSNGSTTIHPNYQIASIAAVIHGIPQLTTTEPTPVASPNMSGTLSLASSNGLNPASFTAQTMNSNTPMDGVRQFIEAGERSSREFNRDMEARRRERGKFETCWISFCSFCCDADPDEHRDLRRVTVSPIMSGNSVEEEQPRRVGRMAYY